MARIETDPNYTSPTFSRATAATDIFKKEDVQALAAAMSTHVHDGAGKGLAIAATGIPAGSITSAMIADGTLTTADIAAGAISQKSSAVSDGSAYTRTIVSSPVAVPGLPAITLTFTGQPVLLLGQLTLQHSAVAATAAIGFLLDGAWSQLGVTQFAVANSNLMLTVAYLTTLSAASHTIALGWDNQTAGTLTRNAWWSTLIVQEFKR